LQDGCNKEIEGDEVLADSSDKRGGHVCGLYHFYNLDAQKGGKKVKALVATKDGQGVRKNDFCWVPEGEIVHFASECDRDKDDVDGFCGCRRAMVGIECGKATTTMKVAELDTTEQQVFERLKRLYMEDWLMDHEDAEKMARGELEDLRRIAKTFRVGAVLEKRGDVVGIRKLSAKKTKGGK
jgi:hypothetical protein